MKPKIQVQAVEADEIRGWRESYRREMDCQIIHDSIHGRPGWTQEYLLAVAGEPAGYGSLAIGGPWRDHPTLYEVYVDPPHRPRTFDLLEALIEVSEASRIEIQSNDPLGSVLVHTYARDVRSESILFEDGSDTHHTVAEAVFRRATAEEAPDVSDEQRRWRAVIEVDGEVAAMGGVLFHYNPPYGDIYMEVLEGHRRRGLGSLMVQELKRRCREHGVVPAARCNPSNLASRRTLQSAGFVPCGHILKGDVIRT
jgi:GNAT superfamily N-acetyltransferase